MLYNYIASTMQGESQSGSIEAANMGIAINSLQNRGLIITSIKPAEGKTAFTSSWFSFFNRVRTKDIVILSRQLATLFEAKVSILESFQLLSSQTKNAKLKTSLSEVVEDIRGGNTFSVAMSKHPDVFSKFYVNMVRSGEESGKLEEIFESLADHLERSYELVSKAKNALVYPIFVVGAFFAVMFLMLTFVIPKLTAILTEVGQDIPFYTKIVIGVSNVFKDFGVFFLIALAVGFVFLWRYIKTESGRISFSSFQLGVPFIGDLYKKFYLARITDNMETLLSSGVSAVKALEISADVVGNKIYEKILFDAAEKVKGGSPISDALDKYDEISLLVVQMIRTGEKTGKLAFMLKTLGKFYKREVDNVVETLVGLIEPVMIVVLGGSVGLLLVSILGPIYNITAGI
ncbi:TPA: hypothetical protein DEW47_01950 [Patescibacteria group bacterium]|nr:MAG: hypothetical protein UU18_C0010G0015 [Parcubacteria group bacterium GW2011_GWB2_40_8]KKR77446.1 MAG: hypothetical protein UU20_C0007G0016 [Parcubacteria group bacterium GW2011_GWE2_40_8]HBB56456.1 hypothetical protein [Patescibacteria group bacterium]HCI04729.1 hypothetical protein [Patescibacteria group bacterium]